VLVSVKKQVRNQVWEIVTSYAPVVTAIAGRTSNLIDPATKEGVARANRNQSPDTTPRIRIDMPRTISSGYKSASFGFDVEDADFLDNDGSGTIEWNFELTLTFVSELVKLDEQDQLVDDAQIALIRAGPKLGLDFVKLAGPFTSQQQEVTSDTAAQAAGTRRLRTVLRVQVAAEFDLQWLIAQTTP
jgi:hypothetical protein